MNTCPWCGTAYTVYEPKCKSCGGSLPLPPEASVAAAQGDLPAAPPPAPRSVPRNHVWRVLFADSGGIVGAIFGFIGAIFTLLGAIFAFLPILIFVGVPFLILGLIFLALGVALLVTRYRSARQAVRILQDGLPVLGQITDVRENVHVQVNGRFPWTISYSFQVSGKAYDGRVSTLSTPNVRQQPGKPVYVLFLPEDPSQNALYPLPYAYWGA